MRARPGIALVVTVLLLAVLGAVGAGIFALGAREAEVAAALVRGTTARLAAESAVRATVDGWSTRHYRTLGPGQSVPAMPAVDPSEDSNEAAGSATVAMESHVVVTRLDDWMFLLEGSAHSSAGPRVVARAGVLVRTFDPNALASAFPAAIAADATIVVEGGQVSGGGLSAGGSPAQDDSAAVSCAAGVPGAAILAPDVAIHDPAAVPGSAGVMTGVPPPIPTPDPFHPPLLADLVTVMVAGGTFTPQPWTDAGGCVTGSSNWGAVSPSIDCHALLPFVWSDGDLTLPGGEGRGLLVVDGDLHLDGFRFEGVILVRGDVLITGGAAISGALRASAAVISDGTLIHDPCAVQAALTAGGLDRPLRPSDRWWIPVF